MRIIFLVLLIVRLYRFGLTWQCGRINTIFVPFVLNRILSKVRGDTQPKSKNKNKNNLILPGKCIMANDMKSDHTIFFFKMSFFQEYKGIKTSKIEDKNYWPVSILSYIGKLTENPAFDPIVESTSRTRNIENNQSTYRVGQSTESALLKVKSYLLYTMDNQEVTCLVLLDLNAAFHTVDHDQLLNRLYLRYVFDETILNKISSYHRSRTQQVLMGANTFSNLS